MFGNSEMKLVNKTVHVGITLKTSDTSSITDDRIKKAKGALLAARGIGSPRIPMLLISQAMITRSTCYHRT